MKHPFPKPTPALTNPTLNITMHPAQWLSHKPLKPNGVSTTTQL